LETGLRERLQRRLESERLPPMIIFDVTNTCNLSCIHCPQPILQNSPGFRSKHLPYEIFEKLIGEVEEVGSRVLLRFTGDGEPTVHPRLFDMLERAKELPLAAVNLTTNGVLLTHKRIDRLLDRGIDLIDVSIDALTAPVYDQVRRGGSYPRLMSNLFYLLDRRAEIGARTKVMVSFVSQKENDSETEAFRAYWTPLVDYVMIRQLHSAVGAISLEKTDEAAARSGAPKIERFPCAHLWKRLTVDFAGEIKFCAHEWMGNRDVVLGNARDSTLREVWAGPALASIRARHVSGDHRPGFICTTCTDWASSKWDFGYERLVDHVVFGTPTLVPELPPLA
jgi:pyruvate-formate lyase-activating enzyme